MKDGYSHWHIYIRDNGMCVYCNAGWPDFNIWRQLIIQHLVPLQSNGPDIDNNLVVSCYRCNILKSIFDPSEGIYMRGARPNTMPQYLKDHYIRMVKEFINAKVEEEWKDFRQMATEVLQKAEEEEKKLVRET